MELHAVTKKAEPPATVGQPPDLLAAARFTHANLQDMVKVADAKAGALIAAQAVVATVLGSAALGEAGDTLARFAGVPGAVARLALLLPSVAAIGLALAVLWPRREESVAPVPRSPRLLWISAEDLGRFKGSTSDYVAALQGAGEADLLADVAFENLKIRAILAEKFKWLKCSYGGLAVAVVSWCVTLLLAAEPALSL